ncbi:hypothetical protein IC744_16220 [Microbacterium hominis]|uniref:hypothetical protein n=1 Tax=Microbacterium hominis TaxID=162426 RepID=UPI00168BA473|nr:hypothetical protein [Microbacterium hominis]QOC28860.1 hypothetical protein IC744_16220 [Microbacterium hominis]
MSVGDGDGSGVTLQPAPTGACPPSPKCSGNSASWTHSTHTEAASRPKADHGRKLAPIHFPEGWLLSASKWML